MAKLAIVGSRNYQRLDLVQALVARLKKTTTVVSGGAVGVDITAENAAIAHGLNVISFRPDWGKDGQQAALVRNRQIVGAADGLIAFWNGRSGGTAHSIRLARQKGIWLRVYGPDGQQMQMQK